MRTLEDSVDIDVPPERLWAWLGGLAEHYTAWHPDHVSATWRRGEPLQVGAVLEAVEDLGGHREHLELEVTAVAPPNRLTYRIRGLHSLLLPGGAFEVSAHGQGSRFTATVRRRGGALTERLLRRRTAALRAHMRQEGENLKRLMEARP